MLDFELRRSLGRTLEPSTKPRPEHRAALEQKLLAEFEKRHPREESYKMKKFGMRKMLLVAAAAMMLGIAACAAPADIEVDVGKRVTIEMAEGAKPPADPEAIVDIVRGSGSTAQVDLRLVMENGKPKLQIEVWGNGLSKEVVAEKIRKTVPELANAQIREEVLEGKVHGTLGEKLGHDLLNMDVIDEEDVELAKEQVMKQLAEQGVTGKVDVDVQNDGPGKRKVRVRVEREDCPDDQPGVMERVEPAPSP
ncbi:MAG TPA: hypothetical protein PK156_05910 [Polyangium sp.]|nr:hypothetical protein [Polyangium sp.]